MSGIYVRIIRDDHPQNLLIEELTDAERVELFKNKTHDELVRWISSLCKVLRP